jgi:hypothetical protein
MLGPMRALAWCFASSLLACGKTEGPPEPGSPGDGGSGLEGGTSAGGKRFGGDSARGGTLAAGASVGGAAAAGADHGDAARSGRAGADTGSSGTRVSCGGGASDAGANVGGNAGGTAGVTGGNAGHTASGEAGDGGATAACSDTYRACGCGCCGGVEPMLRCYYPEIPGHLASIVADDQSVAQREECANVGCSLPVEYVCCDSQDAMETEATYEASVASTALDRLHILRTGADGRCSAIGFANPSRLDDVFRIEIPAPWWSIESAHESGCGQSPVRRPMGGFGQLRWHGDPCVLEFDFTLFFEPAPGAPSAVRFKAAGLPLNEPGALRCE